MPQAARPSAASHAPVVDKDAAKVQEQEFKRARGAISCAECRRLKLKCDKTIPCSSCKRRGCASICPNGSLATGQGTRFILADTDRLHRKIEEMSDRIRQLEDALAILQSSVSREPHPLLRRDLLNVKSGLHLHSALRPQGPVQSADSGDSQDSAQVDEESQTIDAFGTLAVREDGVATFYGRSAGSESLLLDERSSGDIGELDATATEPNAPTEGLSIPYLAATTFPLPSLDMGDLKLSQFELLEERLPEWYRAKELCDLYLEQAPWFFGAVTARQLWEEVMPLFYRDAMQADSTTVNHLGSTIGMAGSPTAHDVSPPPTSSSVSRMNIASSISSPASEGSTLSVATSATAFNLSSPSASASGGISASSQGTPHDLALLFVVFCFGALTDPKLPPARHNTEANGYYELTRAALNLHSVFDRPPSVATVQTLSLMGIYQGLVADEHSIESTWSLMGMSCKLAQSIGLHRDCARWKLPPAEVQKRRALFWELFITDCWQGLATGRLPTFALPYVDTELAADPDETLSENETPQPSFPAWKAMWGKECVSGVVEVTLQARAPKYSLLLELDRKIRDTSLPSYTQGAPPKNASLSETMKHFMPINYRELTLLYVHRCFFAQALADHPTDPLRSQYAPSFLAGYRSACALISTVREQFALFPVEIARFWVLWTHAFSSTVMLASVVTHGGTTKTAQAALSELRLAFDLFERASKYGGRAVKFLPIVRRLHEKAYQAFSQDRLRNLQKDIFTPRNAQEERLDELSIFGGRTRTVTTKSIKQAPQQRLKRSVSRRHISPGVHSPTDSTASGSDSVRSSQSPHMSGSSESPRGQEDANLPSLESYGSSVHPMLAASMRTFESSLEAQIHNTHRVFHTADVSPVDGSLGMEGVSASGQAEYEYRQPSVTFKHTVEPPPEGQRQPTSPPVWGYSPAPTTPDTPSHMQPDAQMYHVPVSSHASEPHLYNEQLHYPPPQQLESNSYPGTVYGAVDESRAMNAYHYHIYPAEPEMNVSHSVHQEYAMMPSPPSGQQHHTHAQLWHVSPQHAYSHSQAPTPQQQYHAQSEYAPQVHGTSHTPTHVYAHRQQPPQHVPHMHHQHQHMAPPLPPPPPSTISVHDGGYSLTETWTSFMQQQLPAPMSGPGPQHAGSGYQTGSR